MVRTLLIVACLICANVVVGPSNADECDALIGRVVAGVPGLKFEKRTHMADNIDEVYLTHPQAKEVSITCSPIGPALNVDWPDGLPPSGYFQLIGQMGSILMGSPANMIRTSAMNCQQQALSAKNEIADTEADGVAFECQAFTRDGGATAITVSRHGIAK